MKLYISCDIEGCAGIVDDDQRFPGGPLYAEGRALMAGEANAAIEGAIEGGARRIVVNDSHASMRNLAPEAMHPAAELILGRVKTLSMIEGLDKGFDGVAFVGYHARAGTRAAAISHTYSSACFREVRVNGRAIGEAGLNAAAAGALGVPVLFLSGDQAAVREIQGLIAGIGTVVTKQAYGRRSARSLHPQEARRRIRDGMKLALQAPRKPAPYVIRSPYRLEVDVVQEEMADLAMRMPGLLRSGANSVTYRTKDYLEMYRAMLTALSLSAAAIR